MDTLTNKFEILKQYNALVERLTANRAYVGFNRLFQTLTIKLESLVFSVRITKRDYSALKKSIKHILTQIKDLIKTVNPKTCKQDYECLTALVNNIVAITDEEYDYVTNTDKQI